MAAWLFSTGISHHNLLPHIPSIRLSAVNNSPHTGNAPQSLNSSSQLPAAPLPGDVHSCPAYVWLWQGLSMSLILFRLPRISRFTLCLKCFSSDSDSCPTVGIRPPASVPPPAKGRSRPTNTPVFPPSSFVLLNFAWFYIFYSIGQVLLSTLRWCSACNAVSKVYS